ncbi:peptidoglycan recognition protein family protein [Desulfoscipio geothermicus]|uniref:N-acetylmuramoyl-L-alanine amidase n=1 Tax=Desulfoscipio geothermicus DSM 3669 TaxID=1121426 RepID=A0A1I6DXK6_9FIRM|nr:N-acetylmuramoyl-L-alanine amidase [Desulfoscipio geothermicus]SFR10165.1 hypothetical protein SAMN05660706_12051 [Desulfoscipio geothermicus DSM 3669]
MLELLARLMKPHDTPAKNILGHREVLGANTLCPGKYFPLAEVRDRLAQTVLQDSTGDGERVRAKLYYKIAR